MSARGGALAIGIVIAALAALVFVGSVNREMAAVHQRLDKHERLIGALAALMPVVRPIPPERPPAP